WYHKERKVLMHPEHYHKARAIVQREQIITADRLLLLVPVKRYGSEGEEPVHPADCPFFQQHGYSVSCVSGSGGSMCGGFMGGIAAYVKCGWPPRQLRPDQRFVVFDEAAWHPDPARQSAPWN